MTRFADRKKPVVPFYPTSGGDRAWTCDHCTWPFEEFDADSYHCDVCGDFDLCCDCSDAVLVRVLTTQAAV